MRAAWSARAQFPARPRSRSTTWVRSPPFGSRFRGRMRRIPIPRFRSTTRSTSWFGPSCERWGSCRRNWRTTPHSSAACTSTRSARCRSRTRSGPSSRTATPDKRKKWIDKVLDRPEYAAYWALKWADILLVNRDKLGDRGAFEMHRWLREQIRRNRPYDEWVRELITASGSSHRNGPVNFYRASATPEEIDPGRQPGVSRRSSRMRPVPPPSVREVGAGRFLRPGRLLQRPAAQEADRR